MYPIELLESLNLKPEVGKEELDSKKKFKRTSNMRLTQENIQFLISNEPVDIAVLLEFTFSSRLNYKNKHHFLI